MKNTRIFAAVLAVMMVVGSLPMMVSAAASESLIDAIATVLGSETAVVATSSTWGVANIDFTAAEVASTEGLTVEGEVTFDATNGAVFPAEVVPALEEEESEGEEETVVPAVKYTGVADNTASITNQGWGALAASGNVAFGFKLNEAGNLTIETEDLYRGGKAHIVVSPTEVVVYESNVDFLTGEEGEANNAIREQQTVVNTNEYAPGTEWNDVLVVKNEATAGGGYKVYMKKATDTEFTLVAEATYFAPGGVWGEGSLRFMGYDAAVNYAVSYIGTEKPIETIEQVMGVDAVSNWVYGKKYTSNSVPEEAIVTGTLDYTSEGIIFSAENTSTFKLELSAEPWKSINATVIKGKFGATDDKIFITGATVGGTSRHYITVYTDRVTSPTGSTAGNFNFGTDWFELLIYSKTRSTTEGHEIWAKNATTDGKWQRLVTSPYRADINGETTAGNGFSIQSYNTNSGDFTLESIDVYKADKTYDTVEEILGGDVVSSYAFDFNSSFDESIMKNSSASLTTGLDCSDEYGLDLNDGDWNFNAYKNKNWSPLNGNLPGDTYIPQALYFNLKLNTDGASTTLGAGSPNTDGRLYRTIKAGAAMTLNNATGTVPVTFVPDTNWMEHLIVPAATETGGYSHYVKSATLTNNLWVKIVDATSYRDAGTQKTGIGINFSAGDACIRSIRTYQVGVKDADAKPANATLLYHEDNMDAEATYPNLSIANGNYETPGVISFPATESSTYGKYNLNYAGIPVGGYAEFKTSSNGTIILNFTDGVKSVVLNTFKPYAGIEGISDRTYLFGEGNNSSRVWRVVRTENGYTFYTKVDGDQGWQKVAENVGNDAESDHTPKIAMTFRNHSDGTSVGTGQLDYMKVYGPAREDLLIVTDGYGTMELKNGDTVGYGNGLRPIVNTASGKVLVVNYEKKRVTKITVLDVSELTVDKMVSVVKEGSDTVKVFLWNDLDGKMANLTEALTLTYPSGE